jgi:hypothetical protein
VVNELEAACRPAPKPRTLADIKARTAALAEARRKRECHAYLAELRAIRQSEREFEEVAAELDALVR